MSLVQRNIELTIALSPTTNPGGTDNFGPGTGNTVTLSGLRMSANISLYGAPGLSSGNVRVWGMTKQQMKQCSALGKPFNFSSKNGITIRAGDDQSGMSLILQGTFQFGYEDFNSAPDASFYIETQVGTIGAMKPVSPNSYQGSVNAGNVMSDIATQMGLNFENSGVEAVLSNPYLHGTLLQQAHTLARAANINMLVDGDPPTGTLAIWPRTGSRNGQAVTIGPTSGLLGYPRYTDGGISIDCLFNPNVQIGRKFTLETSIENAKGDWVIRAVTHALECQLPGGKWFTNISAYRGVSGTIQ